MNPINICALVKDDLSESIDVLMNKDIQSSTDVHEGLYVGNVEDNDDPLKLGRVRVRVKGYMDEWTVETLPWFYPTNTFAGSVKGGCIVPSIHTFLLVAFVDGDIYNGIYLSKLTDAAHMSSHALEDYPNTMVFFETDKGSVSKMNKNGDVYTFKHYTGTTFTIDKIGNVSVKPSGTIEIDGSQVIPNTKGPFNCIPICPFTNQPHVGTICLP